MSSMMGLINIRILSAVILFYCFEGTLAQTVHEVVTYTTKSVEELKCNFTSGFVQWTEQQDDGAAINLFSYDVSDTSVIKQTDNSKYDNFNYSVKGTNQFNLLITKVDRNDGGLYQCIPFSQPTVTFDVSVEVLPASVNMNCTAEAEKATPHISCTCVAIGISSKIVDIEWKGTSTPTTSDTTRTMNNATGTFTIRSNITLPSPDWNSSVSCSLTGFQSQIPERLKSSNFTFSPPACILMHECSLDNKTAFLTCNCRGGFLEIDTFWFYDSSKSVIAAQSSNIKHVDVEPNVEETFYCSGSNGVNQIVGLNLRCQQGTKWWISLIVLPIAVIMIAAVVIAFFWNRCQGFRDWGDRRIASIRKHFWVNTDESHAPENVEAGSSQEPVQNEMENRLRAVQMFGRQVPLGQVSTSYAASFRSNKGSVAEPLLQEKKIKEDEPDSDCKKTHEDGVIKEDGPHLDHEKAHEKDKNNLEEVHPSGGRIQGDGKDSPDERQPNEGHPDDGTPIW